MPKTLHAVFSFHATTPRGEAKKIVEATGAKFVSWNQRKRTAQVRCNTRAAFDSLCADLSYGPDKFWTE